MIKHILVDGDVLVYRFGEKHNCRYGVDEESFEWTDKQAAIEDVDGFINKLALDLHADKITVALSVPTSQGFRKELFPEYKENRSDFKKPVAYEALREHLFSQWEAKIVPQLEADDVIGIMATAEVEGEMRIICSIDKDFLTIPARFYNWGKDERHHPTEEEADHQWMVQTLSGDRVDGFPGLPGIGPKRALGILGEIGEHSLEELWDIVVEAYIAKGLSMEDALLNARMARILRNEDYDWDNREPIIWEPRFK